MPYNITGGANIGQHVLDDSWFHGKSTISQADLDAWLKMGGRNNFDQVNGQWYGAADTTANVLSAIRPAAGYGAPASGDVPGSTSGGGSFGGTVPTPTPYGDFTAPDPAAVANDPYYKFRLDEGTNAITRNALSKGFYGGPMAKRLLEYGQGLASEEAGKLFDRSLAAYGTNRDTNAQNFGQRMGTFNAGLDAFNANTAANLGYGRLDLDRRRQDVDTAFGLYDRDYTRSRDQIERQQSSATQAADDYARYVAQQRAASAAADRLAASMRPAARKPNPAIMRDYAPGMRR